MESDKSSVQSVTDTSREPRLEMSASDILLTQLCRAAGRILPSLLSDSVSGSTTGLGVIRSK